MSKSENMEVSEENKQMKCHIDKNRLANAVLKGKKKSKFDFALGHQISGIEDLMKALHVEGVGEIPVPVSPQVHILLSINLIMICMCYYKLLLHIHLCFTAC